MADKQTSALVKFEGEEYTITEPPRSTSAVVKKEEKRLLGTVDFPSLTEDLGLLGTCFRMAYHGAAGFPMLQVDINQVGYETTKLCDDAALTVNKFKRASETVVNALQSTYEYLLDSMEELAVDSLADVQETAKGMADAAQKLAEGFDRQADKVMAVLQKTYKTQGKQVEDKSKLEQERKDYEARKKRAQADKDEILRQVSEVQMRIQKAEEKEKDAASQYTNFFKRLGAAITRSGGFHEDQVKAARDERFREMEQLNKLNESRRQALGDLAEFGERIKNVKEGEELAEAIIDALHSAIAALRNLADIMRQVSIFWVQMQAHCEELANDKVKERIEKALQHYPEEKRLKVWTSNAFKRDALQFHARWVALQNVCTTYSEKIKITGAELHAYMRETLRPAEAREKVKLLAVQFLDKVNRERVEHAERMRALDIARKEEEKASEDKATA